MRESIGGTWLLGFVVLFIVLFSGYLAVSINYTKAFKVKNQIINLIEQYEGFRVTELNLASASDAELSASNNTEDKIYQYIKGIGYANTTISSSKCKDRGNYYTGGYCIKRIGTTSNGAYYKVTTFINIELPLIWTSFTIPITGETKRIYYDNSNVR